MDVNEYMAVWLVRGRLAEAQAVARGMPLDSPDPPGWRTRLALTLIKLGHRLLGSYSTPQEKTWVGVTSTITESDSSRAASKGYCGYFL